MAFAVGTSLPPQLEGHVRGALEVQVPVLSFRSRIRPRSKTPPLYAARLLWWGEAGSGSVLKPELREGKSSEQGGETAPPAGSSRCALFPVRCDPKGLCAYLADAGQLRIEVVEGIGGAGG
ncbi:unnamed protein product, partial [Chrysoparadoxa australica]